MASQAKAQPHKFCQLNQETDYDFIGFYKEEYARRLGLGEHTILHKKDPEQQAKQLDQREQKEEEKEKELQKGEQVLIVQVKRSLKRETRQLISQALTQVYIYKEMYFAKLQKEPGPVIYVWVSNDLEADCLLKKQQLEQMTCLKIVAKSLQIEFHVVWMNLNREEVLRNEIRKEFAKQMSQMQKEFAKKDEQMSQMQKKFAKKDEEFAKKDKQMQQMQKEIEELRMMIKAKAS